MPNHPALTLPKTSVGSDRVDCLVAKIGFGIEPGRLESSTKQDEFGGSGCSAVASALRSGPRGLYYGIIFRLTSGCSAVASALRSGRRGRWFESTHPDHFLIYYRHTYGSSSDNFAISFALTKLSIGNGPLPAQVTADHRGPLVFPA